VSGLAIGRFEDLSTPDYDFLTDPYLAPYKHYIENPFMGNVSGVPGFPGFNPRDMNEILRFANEGVGVKRTTTLTVDTTRQNAGILNAPFVTKQAEPVNILDSGVKGERRVWPSEAASAVFSGCDDGLFPTT
jgi:hypothetical protein